MSFFLKSVNFFLIFDLKFRFVPQVWSGALELRPYCGGLSGAGYFLEGILQQFGPF